MKEVPLKDLDGILQHVGDFVRNTRELYLRDLECAVCFDRSKKFKPCVVLALASTAARQYAIKNEPGVEIKNGHPESFVYHGLMDLARRHYMRSAPVASKRASFARNVAKLMAASLLQEAGEEAAANRVWE
jgi:hypothetical protein